MFILLWISRHPRIYLAWSIVFSLACAIIGMHLLTGYVERYNELRLARSLTFFSETFNSGTADSRVMGATELLATTNPRLQQLASGKLPPGDAIATSTLEELRTFFHSENSFVVNASGVIVAYTSFNKNVDGVGKDVSFRPYFTHAMSGKNITYPAVGVNNMSRGIYLSVPIRQNNQPPSGVLVVKVSATRLDGLLESWEGGPSALVSPQGVVFASNQPQWLVGITEDVTAEGLTKARQSKQFGEFFNKTEPRRLPFSLKSTQATIDGHHFVVRSQTLDLDDPAGEWQLMLFDNSATWLSDSERLLLGLLLALCVGGMAAWIYSMGRSAELEIRRADALRESEEKMREAKDMAENAARLKSDFLANMSHEIRTPMNAIIGLSYLALKQECSPALHNYLSKIQQAGQHLLGLINDILDFSKLEAGQLRIEKIDFDLEAVLDNVANLIGEKATDKGLELIFDVPPDLPDLLVGDPLRIGQVLINFANNAVKFTEQGSVAIIVSRVEESAEGMLLRFEVRDTGIGLSEEQMARLFQSFSQADASTTRKYGGTGLGLAISKTLAELMGGAVGVSSLPGQGSTFWFTARLQKSERAGQRFQPLPDLRGRRILVADDHEHARAVLADLLGSLGFAVTTVSSGEEAITAVEQAGHSDQGPYEIVFLDWQMPGMDGIEAGRHIRQQGGPQQPHRVLVTSYAREEAMKAAAIEGIGDVLIKPVNASMLFNVVMHLMQADHLDAEAHLGSSDMPHGKSRIPDLRGRRVLLVEDNEINQQVASELLDFTGISVDVANHGAEALARVDEAGELGYDLVLMDVQMPVMDGFTATRELRKRPELAKLPIIAMTANALEEDRQRCLEAGMDDHIAKPIVPDVLWQKLGQLLGGPTAAGVSTLPAPVAPIPAPTPASVPASAPVTTASLLPPPIAGLDYRAGLAAAAGHERLYVDILRKFCQGQADAAERLEAALRKGQTDEAQRLAHTLKGVAGTLGASRLQGLAGAIEDALRQGADGTTVQPQVPELSRELAALIDPLRQHFAPPPASEAPAAAGTGDPASAALLDQLAALLGAGDAEVCELLQAQQAPLQAALGDNYRRIAEAVDSFDFETALAALETALTARSR